MSPDLTIDTALNDPIIRALMKADRVKPIELEAALRATAKRIGPARIAPLRTAMACRAESLRIAARALCFA